MPNNERELTADEKFIERYIETNRANWRVRNMDVDEVANAIKAFYTHANSSRFDCPIFVRGWTASLEATASAFKKVLTRESLLSLGQAIGRGLSGFAVTPHAPPAPDM